MFKKIFRSFIASTIVLAVFSNSAFAITGPTLWKKVGTDVNLVNDAWTLEVANFNVTGLFTFGGVAASDFDLAGFALDNVGKIFGNAAPLSVGTCVSTHGLVDDDDICVEGKQETHGASFFDGLLTMGADVDAATFDLLNVGAIQGDAGVLETNSWIKDLTGTLQLGGDDGVRFTDGSLVSFYIEAVSAYTTLRAGSGSAYTRIGNAGTTSHTLNADDDLLVTGELEVDGTAFLDSNLNINSSGEPTTTALAVKSLGSSKVFVAEDSGGVDRFVVDEAGTKIEFLYDMEFGNANPEIKTVGNQSLILIPNGTGITTIGDAGSTSHGLDANDDLFVTAELEVDGPAFFDGATSHTAGATVATELIINSNVQIKNLATYGSILPRNTAQTVDTMSFHTGTGSNHILITEVADISTDFGITLKDDPTIVLQSNDATDITENLQLSYVGADDRALIETGDGNDILFGSSILAGAYEFAEAVQATFLAAMDIDCGSSMTAGDQCSYIFKVDSQDYLKMYAQSDGSDGTQNEQVRVLQEFQTFGARKTNITTVDAATYDLQPTDDFIAVDYTTTAAVTSLTLMTDQCDDSFDLGREIVIKDTGGLAGTNNIKIDTEGAETIDGNADLDITVDDDSRSLKCVSIANWYIF